MTATDHRNSFIEIHVLRSFPPSNLNRDDLGSPKTAIFGGERRLRISSQCLKRTWRTSTDLTGEFAESQLGVRTAQLPDRVISELKDIEPAHRDGLIALLASIGKKSGKKKAEAGGEDEDEESDDGDAPAGAPEGAAAETAHLLFLSRQEIEHVVSFARDNAADLSKVVTTKKGKSNVDTKLIDKLRLKLAAHLAEKTARNAVDVSLFGRFVTSDEFDTIDGALCVAHAIGTQRVEIEFDYFTAVDDLKQTTGAGHLGETEFASSVMYLYAVCDLHQLRTNLGRRAGANRTIDEEATKLAARSLGALVRAIAVATPTGKKTGTAPYAPAEYVEVVVRKGQPMSYVNAFTKPISARDGDVMAGSITNLTKHRARIESAYSATPEARFVLSLRDEAKGEQRSLADLSTALEATLLAIPALSGPRSPL